MDQIIRISMMLEGGEDGETKETEETRDENIK
jgi:hypothetical protein